MNGPLLGDDPAVRVSVHTAAMATAGIGSAVGRGRHLVRRNAEACSSRRPRAGDSSWCVMPGRTRFVREEAIRRSVPETGRTSSNASSTSFAPEPKAFASQPPAPAWAAVQPARIADLGCAYSSARGSKRRYADDRCSRRRLPGLNLQIWPLPASLFTAPPRQVPETPQVDSISRHE